jgi:hypothetical protein
MLENKLDTVSGMLYMIIRYYTVDSKSMTAHYRSVAADAHSLLLP